MDTRFAEIESKRITNSTIGVTDNQKQKSLKKLLVFFYPRLWAKLKCIDDPTAEIDPNLKVK